MIQNQLKVQLLNVIFLDSENEDSDSGSNGVSESEPETLSEDESPQVCFNIIYIFHLKVFNYIMDFYIYMSKI